MKYVFKKQDDYNKSEDEEQEDLNVLVKTDMEWNEDEPNPGKIFRIVFQIIAMLFNIF